MENISEGIQTIMEDPSPHFLFGKWGNRKTGARKLAAINFGADAVLKEPTYPLLQPLLPR